MKLSPLSIKRQEFSKSLRGYEKDEVHAFLEKLAGEVESLQIENEQLKKELEAANIKIADYKKIEKNLQDTLLKAQESSTRSMESTKKQANLMVKEAEIKASQIIDRARESANEIRNALINLREEKDLILSKLKAIVSSQANLLEMKIEDAGEEIAKDIHVEESGKIDLDIDALVNKLL